MNNFQSVSQAYPTKSLVGKKAIINTVKWGKCQYYSLDFVSKYFKISELIIFKESINWRLVQLW